MNQKVNDELRIDLGRKVIVHEIATKTDCVWCKFSTHHGRSFAQPAEGKVWSTHPNYSGTDRLCPNCLGRGTIETDNITSIDKVIIDEIQGDVIDITLTHIHVDEAGGTITGEEKSGRSIMIPCSTLFEKNIINYTLTDDVILDEVVSSITYESDIKQARKMCTHAAMEILKKRRTHFPKKPYTRIQFGPYSIEIKTRYYTLVDEREAVHSDITQLIFDKIVKNKKVEIAYPHTEVIFRKKRRNK